MTRKPSYTAEDEQRAQRAIRARMLMYGYHHQSQIDIRNGTLLLPFGLLTFRDQDDDVPSELVEIISNPNHENRIPAPLGPLLFYREEENEPRSAAPMDYLLLNPDPQVRRAAFDHFDRLRSSVESVLSPRTELTLVAVATSIQSTETVVWTESAVKLFDAVSDDFLVALAGFKQSETLRYQEGINLYLRFLLRPTISSLETLQFPVAVPSAQRDDLISTAERIAREAIDLEDSLERFFRVLGHLPLHPACGIAKATEPWRTSMDAADAWSRMLVWARAKQSPVPLAHICLLALTDESVLPLAEAPKLWQLVKELMAFPAEEGEPSAWYWAWLFRCDLARHYTNFLECQCPGTESERIANLAWWMVERVASVFDGNAQTLTRAHERVVTPELEVSSRAWELAKPPLLPSLLQYATLDIPCVWSTSLLIQSGAFPARLLPQSSASDAYEVVKDALNIALLRTFPPPPAESLPTVYAFEMGLIGTAESWLGVSSKEDEFEPLLQMYRGSIHEQGIRERLDALKTHPEGTLLHIVDSLKALAWAGRLSDDLLRTYVSDEDWFVPVVRRLPPVALTYLLELLIQLHNQRYYQPGERWTTDVPHFFASALLAGSDDRERQQILFAILIVCCIATETTSALSRVLLSERRDEFDAEILSWVKRLEEPMNYGLPWFQARLRPVVVVLERWKPNVVPLVDQPSDEEAANTEP